MGGRDSAVEIVCKYIITYQHNSMSEHLIAKNLHKETSVIHILNY